MRISWKRLLFGCLVLIAALTLLLGFAELRQIAELFKKARPDWLVFALAVQAAVFVFLAKFYQVLVRGAMSFGRLLKTTLAMVFVDHALPSFSASGNVLLYWIARKKLSRSKSALLIGMNVFIHYFFYFIIFLIGLAYLPGVLKSRLWLLIVLLIIATFVLLYRVIWTEAGARHFKAVLKRLLKRWPRAKVRALNALKGFYQAKAAMPKTALAQAFGWATLIYFGKLAAVFAVFRCLGYPISPGVLIVGYISAAVLAALSYVKLGVYEAALTLAYSGLGIAYDLALAATLLYRALSFWIPFLLGMAFFRSLIR